MKQLLQNMRTGETSVAEVPIPNPQPGEVLIHTCASLVSAGTERMVVEFAGKSLLGKARSRPDLVRQVLDKARREGALTTMEAAFNRLDQPSALGYSSAGVIVTLGEGVQGLRTAQRVACAGGNYAVHAEFACIPRILVTPLPDPVDFESAAFTTLGAIAMHGFRLAEAQLGEHVAVIGLGLLGLLAAQIARAGGCRVLGIDLDPRRVELAHRLGLEAVQRSEAEEAGPAFTRGRGFDSILICADTSSDDPVQLAGILARDRGRVVATGAVGLQIPRKIYYEKEISFVNSRSYGPGRYDPGYEEAGQDYPLGYVRWTEGRNLEAFVDLLASGQVDVRPLITHRIPIENGVEAYELITGKRQEPFLGVLLTYPELQPPSQPAVPISTPKSTLSVDQTTTPDRLRLGVLGAGSFATAVLLPAIRAIPQIERLGIVSASGLSAQHAANRFGFRYADSQEERLLDDPEINTLAILTRHHLHARLVVAALRCGKNVFCEKPLAVNEEQLTEIIDALGDRGGEASFVGIGEQSFTVQSEELAQQGEPLSPIPFPLLTVGFNRRFAPLAQEMIHFFTGSQEPLVAHYRVNAGYIPLTHWLHDPAQGGGRIIGEGCHFVDFLTFLVGQPPVAVSAYGLPDAGRYREDNVNLTFRFPEGSLGTVTYLANGDKSFPKERIEVFSTGRVAVLDDFRSLEIVQNGRRKVIRSRLRQDKGHRAEWQAFSKAILAGGPPPIPYDQLVGVTRATFAAVQALRCGTEQAIPTG